MKPRKRLYLPYTDWPKEDRALWEAAFDRRHHAGIGKRALFQRADHRQNAQKAAASADPGSAGSGPLGSCREVNCACPTPP
jgi:hypothetical protein